MSSDSQTMTRTMQQLKAIYDQVSLLLRTADELMQDAEWSSNSNTAYFEGSVAIYKPRAWAPTVIQRTYVNEELKHHLKMISVVLDDENHPLRNGAIIIGTTVTGQSPDASPGWVAWDAYWWHRQFHSDSEDSTVHTIYPQTVYPQDERMLDHVTVFARPLTAITDTDTLSEYIIEPLKANTPQPP